MLKIHFLPDSDLEDFSQAIGEYDAIWKADGQKIVDTWRHVSGYSFAETYINAAVFGKGGHSHPLGLKSGGSIEEKKAHLVHELGHRVLFPTRKVIYQKTKTQLSSLENHKILFLVLYDVYEALYGKDFADRAVKWDRDNLPSLYNEAWDFALSFKTVEVRREKFREMMSA